MIRNAKTDVCAVGYVFTVGAHVLVSQLAKARQERCLKVTFIGNRMEEQIPDLKKCWPAEVSPPLIYTRRSDPSDSMRALHAKLLLCDSTSALVTSANFSHHGLHENIEVGLKVNSPVVAKLVDYVNGLIAAGEVVTEAW